MSSGNAAGQRIRAAMSKARQLVSAKFVCGITLK